MPITILRPPDAFKRLGISKSVGYQRIADGLLPTFSKLGGDARCAGAADFEYEAIARAYLAGADDNQIRALVDRIHKARARIRELPDFGFDAAASSCTAGVDDAKVPA